MAGNMAQKLKKFLIVGLVLTAVFIWYAVFREGNRELSVAFLNVGQGDAIFIEAPNGNQLLFDGGPNKAVLGELSAVMPFYDRSLDALILSHPNKDHLTGILEALKRYDVGFVMESGERHTIPEYAEWEKEINGKKLPRIFGRAGMRVRLGANIYMDILSPSNGDIAAAGNVNDVMLTGRLVYGNTAFLFTGDMSDDLERRLAADGAELRSDVLKVAHHGSRYSSASYFLREVSPRYAVIGVGKNSYGHPTAETLARLAAVGADVFRTDVGGRIVFESDGDHLILRRQ